MATLKHIASKNSDYTAIEAYLVYQHDAFTGKQLLDEHGKPKLRDSYLLDTLECGDFSFATACLLANRKYGKNTQHGDIKSHQYIISFDPRDAADNGLTMEKAQALGLKFCSENFPGHPAIVCTHPDGHNHSGNIHVHIVIGSVRTREVERKPYMQKPRDWLEGMKHSSTAQTMRHLRVEVMELCEGAGLYQIDLLNGSKERVSEAEYWARRRGQLKLDRENAALLAAGQQPTQTKFETAKEILRKQITDVLDNATNFEDFSDRLMRQYGIAVKESRGCLSYLPAGRTKFIRAKHLGDKFDKAAVLATLQANAERKPKAQFKQDTIGKLIDIQSRMTEGKGIGYKRWLTKHNLKVMAQTVKLLQEKGLTDEDALNQRITELETKYHDSLAVVKDLEGRMKFNKELRYHVAAYASTKNVAQQLKTANRPADFENQHRAYNRLGVVVPLALGIMLLLLFAALGKFRQAALLMCIIPLALFGGMLALNVRGMTLNVSSAVGFIALIGVAIQNGVIMISHINNLRERGRDLRDAVVTGVRHRFRPILMTATVAVLGLLPASLSTGIGSDVQRPLATVIVYGLLFATVVTLYILPTLYYMMEKKEDKKDENEKI